jgi:hypothetical protein
MRRSEARIVDAARSQAKRPRYLDPPALCELGVLVGTIDVLERDVEAHTLPIAPTAISCGGSSMSSWNPGPTCAQQTVDL